MDQTTEELISAFRRVHMERTHSRRFLDLLAEADLVKFAKLRPPDDQAHAALARARQIVDVTKTENFGDEDSETRQRGKFPIPITNHE